MASLKAIIFDIKFEGAEGALRQNTDSDKYFADNIQNKNITLALALTHQDRKYEEKYFKPDKLTNNQLDTAFYKFLRLGSKSLNKNLTINVDDKYFSSQSPENKQVKDLFNNITFYGHSSIADLLIDKAKHAGVIDVLSSDNQDKTVRYNVPIFRLVTDQGISYIPSLPLAAALSVLPDKEKQNIKLQKNKIIIGKRSIPIDEKGRVLIHWHGLKGSYNYVPIAKILLTRAYNDGKIQNVEYDDKISPSIFRDKIVVIGQTAAGTDILPTPIEMTYPGPEIMATVIDNYLNDIDPQNFHPRKFITKAPFWMDLSILLIFCSAVGIFNIKSRSNFYSLLFIMLAFILFCLISLVLFVHPSIRIWINMIYPSIFIVITSLSTYLYKISLEEKEKMMVENLFGRFVSPR